MMVFWVVLIIALIYWIIRAANRNSSQQSLQSESAMDILKKRYARGELSKEEFEMRKKDLL
ncbi:MAG: SHOCT domain-containing protein [Chitinispirillaceae bacterium]|nr:SHOCT domain-containing protein [Chitinispirillaceae bacterium]